MVVYNWRQNRPITSTCSGNSEVVTNQLGDYVHYSTELAVSRRIALLVLTEVCMMRNLVQRTSLGSGLFRIAGICALVNLLLVIKLRRNSPLDVDTSQKN